MENQDPQTNSNSSPKLPAAQTQAPDILITGHTTLHELGFLIGLLLMMIVTFFLFYVAIPILAHPYLQESKEVPFASEQLMAKYRQPSFTQLFPTL